MLPTPEPITLLQRLRSETHPYHDALEQQEFNRSLQAGTITTAETARFLEQMYGFLLPYEEALRQHDLPAFWEIPLRCRAHLIAADLGPMVTKLPRCPAMPPLTTQAQLLGVMYVLEGSTLGGQVINRQLAKAEIPLRTYFTGNGEQTGSLWKSFCTLLTAASTPDTEDAIIQSASLTFQLLHAWLIQP